MRLIIGVFLFMVSAFSSFILFAKMGVPYQADIGLSLLLGMMAFFAYDYYAFKKSVK
jgi:hypothetical protein